MALVNHVAFVKVVEKALEKSFNFLSRFLDLWLTQLFTLCLEINSISTRHLAKYGSGCHLLTFALYTFVFIYKNLFSNYYFLIKQCYIHLASLNIEAVFLSFNFPFFLLSIFIFQFSI